MARQNADCLVGGTGADRSGPAWAQAYRALEHGTAREACKRARKLGFPADIVAGADTFTELQQLRHDADYNPGIRLTRAEALAAISDAASAIERLRRAPRKDRVAFAIQLLLRRRG